MKDTLPRLFLLLFCAVVCLWLSPAALADNGAFTIPPNTTHIEAEAFAGCSGMTSVTIPAGVKSIDKNAFAGCPNLTDVYFEMTFEKFKQSDLYVDIGNEALMFSVLHFSDGQIALPVSERLFPDDVFRDYVASTFDTDQNGLLSQNEIDAVTQIRFPGDFDHHIPIASLKGIEYFGNLTTLMCQFSDLSALDVSKNTKLEVLYVGQDQIRELELTHNPKLRALSCVYSQLDNLDVTQNPLLEYLYCSGNGLDWLDLTNNPKLLVLYSHYNGLKSLNLSANTALQELYISNNELTSLNLTNNTALESLDCRWNHLTNLNVGGCSAMKSILCGYNMLSSINLQSCTSLVEFSCSSNSLTALNVGNCRNLQYLFCWRNNLSSVNLSQNTALVRVNLSANNSLSSLTLGSMQNLEMLWVQNTKLSSLNISNCPTIVLAYRQGTRYDFGREGMQIDNGNWYGYQYGSGLNPGSTSPVDHCQFCVDKATQLTA